MHVTTIWNYTWSTVNEVSRLLWIRTTLDLLICHNSLVLLEVCLRCHGWAWTTQPWAMERNWGLRTSTKVITYLWTSQEWSSRRRRWSLNHHIMEGSTQPWAMGRKHGWEIMFFSMLLALKLSLSLSLFERGGERGAAPNFREGRHITWCFSSHPSTLFY